MARACKWSSDHLPKMFLRDPSFSHGDHNTPWTSVPTSPFTTTLGFQERTARQLPVCTKIHLDAPSCRDDNSRLFPPETRLSASSYRSHYFSSFLRRTCPLVISSLYILLGQLCVWSAGFENNLWSFSASAENICNNAAAPGMSNEENRCHLKNKASKACVCLHPH